MCVTLRFVYNYKLGRYATHGTHTTTLRVENSAQIYPRFKPLEKN